MELLRHVFSQIWTWWQEDFAVLGEAVGPRWWYLVILVVVALGEWFAGTAEGRW